MRSANRVKMRSANWFPLFNDEMQQELLGTTLRGKVNCNVARDTVSWQMRQTDAVEPLNRLLYLDTKSWLPDYLLLRG